MNCYPIINQVPPARQTNIPFIVYICIHKKKNKKKSWKRVKAAAPPISLAIGFIPAVCGIFRTEPNEKYFNVKITEKAGGEKGKKKREQAPQVMRPMIIISFQFAVPTGRRQFSKKDEAHTEEPNDSRLAPTWCFRNMCKQLRASGEREPKRDLPFWIADHHPSIQPSVCLVFLFFFSPIFSSIRMSCSLKEAVNVRRFLLYEYIPGPTWSSPFFGSPGSINGS